MPRSARGQHWLTNTWMLSLS